MTIDALSVNRRGHVVIRTPTVSKLSPSCLENILQYRRPVPASRVVAIPSYVANFFEAANCQR